MKLLCGTRNPSTIETMKRALLDLGIEIVAPDGLGLEVA